MNENDLELEVGDLLYRKRQVSDLLEAEVGHTVPYGPLTLELAEDGRIIPLDDLDGGSLEPIEVVDDDDRVERVEQTLVEVDNRVEQLLEEEL